MVVDEEEPIGKRPAPRNLEPLSVAELEAYIGELEAEITRARAVIASKQAVRSGAESLFRK